MESFLRKLRRNDSKMVKGSGETQKDKTEEGNKTLTVTPTQGSKENKKEESKEKEANVTQKTTDIKPPRFTADSKATLVTEIEQTVALCGTSVGKKKPEDVPKLIAKTPGTTKKDTAKKKETARDTHKTEAKKIGDHEVAKEKHTETLIKTEKRKQHIPLDFTKQARLLKEKQLLLNRYEVEALIGGGGFAQVFIATDTVTKTKCAVKIEPERVDRRRMMLEATVLILLRGQMNIPEILAMGTSPTGHFMVLQLVGKNLSDIRRQLPNKKLTPSSLFRSCRQVLSAISLVHAAGFIHRDLKPSNCCIGHVDLTRIYLLDYGLTRQYIDSTGRVRKARPNLGMRGTLRYVSCDVHTRKDLGPSNDLVAWFYSLIELGDGSLPWNKLRLDSEIHEAKKNISVEKLCEKQPKCVKMGEYILTMKYETIPDYNKLFKMVDECIPTDVTDTTPYDWQRNSIALDHKLIVRKEGADEKEKDKKAHDPEQKLKAAERTVSGANLVTCRNISNAVTAN